jgi:hypothetical protein
MVVFTKINTVDKIYIQVDLGGLLVVQCMKSLLTLMVIECVMSGCGLSVVQCMKSLPTHGD